MVREFEGRKSRWCIVIADDHAPEWVAYGALELRPAPVQYSSLGGSATLLRLALQRAASIAPTSQILVTALEEYRNHWEPVLWSVRPEMRFVSDKSTSPASHLGSGNPFHCQSFTLRHCHDSSGALLCWA